MVAVFSAMGLFNVSNSPPDPKKMDRIREWTASLMVPFSARMVVEKLACDGENGYAYRSPWESELGEIWDEEEAFDDGGEGEDEEYVRIFVNDALQPLEFCGAEHKGARKGLCSLKKFVESQGYARRNGGGDFLKCYN